MMMAISSKFVLGQFTLHGSQPVNKDSDMAIFTVTNANDEVSQYQMGHYVSSNEAIWRIFSFAIHEKYPTVVHLAVHLENGQRVYFNELNVVDRTARPPSRTLTNFYTVCQTDDFARTLLYANMPRMECIIEIVSALKTRNTS